eukprot:8857287-Alexandrium_andersonii.AAC.1
MFLDNPCQAFHLHSGWAPPNCDLVAQASQPKNELVLECVLVLAPQTCVWQFVCINFSGHVLFRRLAWQGAMADKSGEGALAPRRGSA